MSQDDIIHDLSKEVAKMYIDTKKLSYRTEEDFSTMVADFFKAYSIAYTMLEKSKKTSSTN